MAASLREEGWEGAITLLSNEDEWPYQRPPLSKTFLKDQGNSGGLPLRAEKFFGDERIDLRRGEKALRIDRRSKRVELANGVLPYDHLILATGARQRVLQVPGIDLKGVFSLRGIVDARRIRENLAPGRRIVVIGAGFIGLEVAATAVALGAEVAIVEIAERPLVRAVSHTISTFLLAAHQASGVAFRLGQGVTAIRGASGHVSEVELSNGERLPADVVIAGVGVTAEDGLARESGLDCANGIIVDEFLLTSDPTISAIGDCAQFPSRTVNAPLRLESVQNAVDHARGVARRLLGRPERYEAVPWFWSDQGDLKLQIVGLSHGVDHWVLRGDPQTRAFSLFGFRGGALAVVETMNRGGEHSAARRLIGRRIPLLPEQAASLDFDLKKLALATSA